MSESLSAEQVRQRNEQALGQELGELYTVLSNELITLRWCWDQLVQLFATKRSRVELLNRSAPFFFYVVQETLWDEALLSIARPIGPSFTGKGPKSKPNLTIQRLPGMLPEESLKQEVANL